MAYLSTMERVRTYIPTSLTNEQHTSLTPKLSNLIIPNHQSREWTVDEYTSQESEIGFSEAKDPCFIAST